MADFSKSELPTTLEEFLEWKIEDEYKYEWYNGEIIRSKAMPLRLHFNLVSKLERLFYTTKEYEKGGALFQLIEIILTPTQVRKPAFSYLTNEEIENDDEFIVPKFCIETVADDDLAEAVIQKTVEYLEHGVEILWLLFPKLKVIKVIKSDMTGKFCRGDEVASAHPVIQGFEISPNDLYEKLS